MALKTGAAVRLIQPELRGHVVERRIVADELELLIEWDEGGQSVRRWIDADKVEALPETAPEGSEA
jgi:hypothetical protein